MGPRRDGSGVRAKIGRCMSPEKLLRALATTEMAIFSQDSDLVYRWVHNARESWLGPAQPGQRDSDLLTQQSAQRAASVKEEVLRTQRPARFELSVSEHGSVRWYDVRVDFDDEIGGIIGTSVDITLQKQREDTLKALLRELSHRSKNLLAIIQSLASQTARNSVTVPEFLVRFRGRIQSLSYSQDIVTDADWRGADLPNLVQTQVERYAPDGMAQIELDVADVYLTPTASLHVGLALHELAVNAASYGSLSVPGGIVSISAGVEAVGEETQLVLEWRERSGPRVRQDRDARFGTSTLARIVPNAVGGAAELHYLPGGLHYRLIVPDTQFDVRR